ncbi:MAG: PSD1 and planctomycete cytochrome C domain-containing protein [Opitutaceae bacterium]|nr:PSD1 and planctomycete cytochrome C domain-containing protein [Opitutaceae bacterium]
MTVDYERDVRPLLAASCLDCHGPKKQRSDFRVDVKKIVFAGGAGGLPAVVPGKSAESPLIHYVAGLDAEMQMPPAGKGDPLTPEQIGILRAWIDQGAAWPEHATTAGEESAQWWSLLPLAKPAVPTLAQPVGTPVDAFLEAKRAEKKLTASPAADRRTLLRRVAITLNGLPPTPDEIEAFVGDPDPRAYEKIVDRLLASPRFGERWAQFWLDIVRWSETNGSESNLYRKNTWPYRDYVIRAFNSDLPFDRFIREQIAGDALGVDEATAFLVSGGFVHAATVGREEPAIRQARSDRLDETIQSVSASLLGMTMACARCHNHKFDPIPQKDYYALAAVFQGLEYGHRPWRNAPDATARAARADSLLSQFNAVRDELRAATPSWTEEWPDHLETRFAPVRARAVRMTFVQPAVAVVEEFQIFGAATGETNLALAAHGATARSFKPAEALMREVGNVIDGKFGQTFAWRTREASEKADPTAPAPRFEIELPAEAAIDRVVISSDREALAHTDYLIEPGKATASGPRKYRVEVRGDDGAWREVAHVDLPVRVVPGGRAAAKNAAPAAPPNEATRALLSRLHALLRDYTDALPPPVFAGYFVPPVKTHLFGRGDPMAPREEVVPNGLTALRTDLKLTSESGDQERRLAYAAWLTDPQRNPLTPRVLANRLWLHVFGRGLVDTPGDFGQAGSSPSHPELLDWLASEFIASGWSAKLMIRQLVLSAAFCQSSAPNAEAETIDVDARLLWRFPPRRVEAEVLRNATLAVAGTLDLTMGGPGFRIHADKRRYEGWKVVDNFGPGTWRRLIYQENMRGIDDRMFTAFDRPECGQVTPKRTVSTTPLQALNLFNGDFIVTQAEKLAERVQREAGPDVAAQIKRIFALVHGRAPTATEAAAAQTLVAQDRLPALGRVLLNTNEFAFIE